MTAKEAERIKELARRERELQKLYDMYDGAGGRRALGYRGKRVEREP